MCVVCGGTGYKQAVRSGVGTSIGNILWANYVTMEPCDICFPMWRVTPWGFGGPQPLVVPLPNDNT